MSSAAVKVLASVAKNGDIGTIISEDAELFGPLGVVLEFYRDYYVRHKSAPTLDLVNERFPEAEIVSTDGPTAYYLDELRNEFVRGRINSIFQKSADALDVHSPTEVLDKINTSFAKLNKFIAGSKDVDVMDPQRAMDDFLATRREIDANGGTLGIMTGFDPIDINFPTGLAGGQIIYLMGYSAKGKTYFSNMLSVNAWRQGKRVLFVSLEMTAAEQRNRLFTILGDGEYNMNDFSQAKIGEDTFRNWTDKQLVNNPGIIVVDGEGVVDVTPNMLQGKIDKYKPDLVIYDYMQLGMNNAKSTEMTPRMMNLSRELKLIATRNKIPVIAVTAVTDESGKNRDEPPQVFQIAWSRAMEYDAHLILAVHRFDNSNVVDITARKNRNGDLFSMQFDVDFAHGVWTPDMNPAR